MSLFDPDTLTELVNRMPSSTPAIVSSMVIAVLRILFDKEETKWLRIALEMALCGALTYVACAGVNALGLNLDWAVVVGGSIGYLGPVTARSIAMSWINKRIKGVK